MLSLFLDNNEVILNICTEPIAVFYGALMFCWKLYIYRICSMSVGRQEEG